LNGEGVRRRIKWYLDQRVAIANVPGGGQPQRFEWKDIPRPRIDPNDASRGFRDFRKGENRVFLHWGSGDGGIGTVDDFLDEVELQTYIIRLVYDIQSRHLIPSEILADAKLVYENHSWVDSWSRRRNTNGKIIYTDATICPPPNRHIQFSGYCNNPIGRNVRSSVQRAQRRTRVIGKIHSAQKKVEIPEIPDDACFFAFKAGAFYEKDQKPGKSACREEEKQV